MFEKLSGFSSNNPKDDGGIDKVILDAVGNIAKRDQGNILFLFSDKSYKNYTQSREEIKSYHIENRQDMSSKQRTNSMNMTYSISDSELTIRNTVKIIKSDFETAAEAKCPERLIFSVFTKSRAELDEVAIQCLALEDVNVYIL